MTRALTYPSTTTKKPVQARIKQLVNTFSRLTLTSIVTFGIGTLSIVERYNNYWNKTIFRVQTVDFNILSHTLPTKLSYVLITNQPKELQRTLDSNYGLFGLVVTDASGQKIVAASGTGLSNGSWSSALSPQRLQANPYDLLLDPPPLFSQGSYTNPHAVERTATNLTNHGQVIGRVYYIRGGHPSFQKDFVTWLKNPIVESSRGELYTLTMLACLGSGLAFWSLWEYLLYQKQVQRLKAEENERRLAQQNETLKLQLSTELNQFERLRQQGDQELLNSTKQAEELSQRNQQLLQEISQLRETLATLPADSTTQTTQAEINRFRASAEATHEKQLQQEAQIRELNQQLQVYQIQLTEAKQQDYEQQRLQTKIREIETTRTLAQTELNKLRSSENQFRETIKSLERQLTYQQTLQEQLKSQLATLQQTFTQSQRQEQESHQKAERLKQEITVLAEEMERIREDMGQHSLNRFETKIFNCLQTGLPQKEILTQFDVGTGSDNSKFTDFIVVLNGCLIIVEAKSYKGLIKSVGDPRNTNWTCKTGNSSILVNACWGTNPYQQVKNYVDSLVHRTRSRKQCQRIPVYGVVVFPSGARIDERIASNIGSFFRVSTLKSLLATLQEIETISLSRQQNHMSCSDLLKLLNGSDAMNARQSTPSRLVSQLR